MQIQWAMKIFILEDDRTRVGLFAEALGELFHTSTDVATDMTEVPDLYKPPYDLLLLDHDLGGLQMVDSGEPNTGFTFVEQYLKHPTALSLREPIIVIHSYNPDGAKRMQELLFDRRFGNVTRQPFGIELLRVLMEMRMGVLNHGR